MRARSGNAIILNSMSAALRLMSSKLMRPALSRAILQKLQRIVGGSCCRPASRRLRADWERAGGSGDDDSRRRSFSR